MTDSTVDGTGVAGADVWDVGRRLARRGHRGRRRLRGGWRGDDREGERAAQEVAVVRDADPPDLVVARIRGARRGRSSSSTRGRRPWRTRSRPRQDPSRSALLPLASVAEKVSTIGPAKGDSTVALSAGVACLELGVGGDRDGAPQRQERRRSRARRRVGVDGVGAWRAQCTEVRASRPQPPGSTQALRSSPNRPIAAMAATSTEVTRADIPSRDRLQRPAHAERPARHRRRGPPRTGRRDQPVVLRRLEARGARQDRFRAPLRARDVPGLAACRQGRARRPRPGCRRDDERIDLAGPDELLRDDAGQPARARPLARGGSDGHPPRRAEPGEPGQPARGRQEREALVVRQPAVRLVAGEAPGPPVPARSPVPPSDDRLDGRPRRGVARGRVGVLPHLLRAEQRGPERRR